MKLKFNEPFWQGFRTGFIQGAVCIGLGCFVWVLYEVLK